MTLRILLADDHRMFREGIRTLLEKAGLEVVAEASDGREVLRLGRQRTPDIAVLDLRMPLLNGIDAARELQKQSPKTRTILLTMFEEDAYVLEALQAGIRGYVLKTQAGEELVNAIREVARGATYLSPDVSRAVVDAYLTRSDVSQDPLTDRERQVLQLVAEGNTTKQVASILGVSVKTAESHRTRLMKKLDIHETAGLVRYAVRRGLIDA